MVGTTLCVSVREPSDECEGYRVNVNIHHLYTMCINILS